MKRISSILLGILALCSTTVKAQHAMGLVVGDYNSPYSYSLNPALSRTNPSNRAYINWWGASVSLENNFMQYKAPFRLGAWIDQSYPAQYADINGSLAFQQDWLPVNTDIANFKLNYLAEVNGPSFFIPVDEVGTFGFGFKEVSGFSVNGVNGDFGGILRYGLPHLNKNAGKTINQNEFSINTERYQEWFMNFAGIAQTDDIHVWKWGTTLKLLIGMGMAHLGSDNLNFSVSSDAKNIDVNQFNGRMFRSNTGAYTTLDRPLGMSFDFADGVGVGTDLGVVYEYRPNGAKKAFGQSHCDREIQQQYRWKLGASITDLGFINYWGEGSQIVSAGNTNWIVDPKVMQNTQVGGEDRLNNLENRLFQALGAEQRSDINSTTPAALNVQFDQYLGGKLHIGTYWTQNLKRANSVGLRRASYLNITPRWQTEQYEYGFPITVANDYTALHVGVYGRLGPVIIGTDNLSGLGSYIQNSAYSGGSFYFGVRSKIGGCDKRTKRYSYFQKETFYDTLIQRDTQQIKIVKVERDTIFETKKETTTIKDEAKNESAIALEAEKKKWKLELDEKDKKIITLQQEAQKAQKECTDRLAIWKLDAEKCKKAQSDIEAQIKKKEAEILLKEKAWNDERARLIRLASEKNSGLPRVDTIKIDCAPEINKAKAEIELAKADRNKALIELEEAKKFGAETLKKCDEEKKSLQALIDKLQAEIALLKKAKSDIEAENKILKDQVDRLSGEALKQPCDVKIAELEKKWSDESRRNAQIALELEREKAKVRAAQIALEQAENRSKLAVTEAAEAKNEASKWKNAHDQLLIAKKLCDDVSKNKDAEIAALKAQIAVLKLENENLKKSANTDMSKTAAEDCTPFKTKLAASEAELIKLKADLAALQAEKAKADLALSEAKKSLVDTKSLQDEIARLKAQIAVLEKEKATMVNPKPLQDEIARLKAQIAVLEKEKATVVNCDPIKAEVEKLKAQIVVLEKEKATVVNCDPIKAEIEKLKAQIVVLEKEKATVVNCDPIKAEVEKLKAQIAVLEKEKAAVVNPKPLQDEIARLKAQIAVLEKEKAAVVDCSVCDKALAESKAALVLAEAKIKALEADKATCAAQLAELKQQQAATLALQADNESLKKKLSEVEERVSELELQLGASDKSAELNAEINRLKEEIKKKDNQISGCNLLADKCTKKTVELEAKLATSEKDRALLNTQYEDLKRQIITMDEDMGKLGEIIKTNNAEISKLNAEMGGLRTRLKECETKLNAATAPKEETPN